MIVRLALRSLATRPLRTAVLSIGFGLGIAVMAELLGVGEVILQQAHSPALAGGGDELVTGGFGPLESGRFVMSSVLGSDRFRTRIRTVAPSRRATLYLMGPDGSIPVNVRGGIPSRDAAIGDPEVAGQPGWVDTSDDTRWLNPAPGDLLRAMDRFHPVPSDSRAAEAPDRSAPAKPSGAGQKSWAEWLYFNARSQDGALRFYLTFLATAPDASGARPTYVRLQLNRNGKTTNYAAFASVDAQALLDRAPDLDVGGNHVRLDSSGTYRITLALASEPRTPYSEPRTPTLESRVPSPESRVKGELTLTPAPGRSFPPATIHGARGWMSGYVVPVLSGTFSGRLLVDGQEMVVDGADGYHDHNWGFWEGVTWQWGQVANSDLSIVYGRVFPPPEVADRNRVPGALAVIGRDGLIAFSTDVSITEDDQHGTPRTVIVQSRDRQLTLMLRLTVSEGVRTPLALTQATSRKSQVASQSTVAAGTPMFLQLGGTYQVTGRAGDRDLNFTARGSAETFRPR